VLKTLRDKYPSRLHSLLISSNFEEPRKGVLEIFFDKSKTNVGRQSIQNRLNHIRKIERHWDDAKMSNDSARILVEDSYFSYHK